MEYKFDRETAIEEFEKFCDANELDHDEAGMTGEDLKAFKVLKERFVKCCRQGAVVVDGCDIEYTISDFSEAVKGEKIIIKRPRGSAFIAMDGYKDGQSFHKLQGYFSAMTGKEPKFFSKLDVKDWGFFNSVAMLFLSE